MAKLFGKKYTRTELLKHMGDVSQVGGVRLSVLKNGSENGVEVADISTGAGLRFTITFSRGMDISFAEYKGVPLCWVSPTGVVGPEFFEPEGLGGLRSFFGGLLTTCGLTYVGSPCVDGGKTLGLHGRVANTPAKNIYADGEWKNDDYIISVRGKMKEACVMGENVQLTREIKTKLGEKRLWINDTVENLGYEKTEHMLLYHINLGFPIVDRDSRFYSSSKEVVPRADSESEKHRSEYNVFTSPLPGVIENVFYHRVKPDKTGQATACIVNEALNDGTGLGVYIKYSPKELPNLGQWKMLRQGSYVVGIEPANCKVDGRDQARKDGTLKFIQPGEKKEYHLEIGVLSTKKEIEEIKNSLK